MIDMNVIFLPAAVDACAFYRMYMPHLYTYNSDYYFTGWKDKKPKDMDFRRIVGRKVAVVQRQSTIQNLKAMQNMHKMGLKIIYDLDDNMWNLPHANPGKRAFEVHVNGFAMCAQEADLLTVSTQGLRTAASTAFKVSKEKIMIIPNAIDTSLFRPKLVERDDEQVVIGWGGSNTHTDDVKDVFTLLPSIMNKNPQAITEIVGAPARKEAVQEVRVLELKEKEEEIDGKKQKVPDFYVCEDVKTEQKFDLPWRALNRTIKVPVHKKTKFEYVVKEIGINDAVGKVFKRLVLVDSELSKHRQYRFKTWAPIREYANRYASWAWDIAIAPLDDNRFNNSKSNIKMLEAASMKIPCLASTIQPYVEFASLGGPDLTWLLCSKLEEWEEKLTKLINDAQLRKRLGERMYETMIKYFHMERIKDNWHHAFRTVLNS